MPEDTAVIWPNESGKAFAQLRERTKVGQAFPVLPVTEIPAIEACEHKREIFDLLLSGWSPAKVARNLYKQHGVVMAPHEIANFLTVIPPAMLLPPSYLRKRLKQIDITIDAVGELGRLLALQSERLDAALVLEEVTQKPLPLTDKLTKTYWKMLLEYTDKLQSIGDLPTEPVKIEAGPGRDSGLPRLKDLLTEDKAADASE